MTPPDATTRPETLPAAGARGARRVAVLGLGVSGLSAALEVLLTGTLARGDTLALFEAQASVGGVLTHTRREGFLLEHGAQGVLSTRASFARAVGLADLASRCVPAGPRARARYLVLASGALFRLTPLPWKWVRARVLSVPELLRAAAEPFVPRARAAHAKQDTVTQGTVAPAQETVFGFFERRFGEAVARRVVVPAATGVWAGGARSLLIARAFPILVEWESRFGSIGRALLALLAARLRRGRSPARETEREPSEHELPRGLLSFKNGLSEFSAALLVRIEREAHTRGVDLALNLTHSVAAVGNASPRPLALSLAPSLETNLPIELLPPLDAEMTHGTAHDTQFDACIVAFAPWAARGFSFSDPASADEWQALSNEIKTHGVAVVGIGGAVPSTFPTPHGFGALAPEESDGLLGILNIHDIAPAHVPPSTETETAVLFRVLLGGDRNPQLVHAREDELVARALVELKRLAFVPPDFLPTFAQAVAWPRAIALLDAAHARAIVRLETISKRLPGVFFAGNYMDGVGVADCLSRSQKIAAEVAVHFAHTKKG